MSRKPTTVNLTLSAEEFRGFRNWLLIGIVIGACLRFLLYGDLPIFVDLWFNKPEV